MKRFSVVAAFLAAFVLLAASGFAAEGLSVPVKGMVTMAQFGSRTCMPCRLMQPTITELEKEYNGRAAIVEVDVDKYMDVAMQFGIRATPTQIFFNSAGQIVAKHEGYLDKKTLVHALTRMGVK